MDSLAEFRERQKQFFEVYKHEFRDFESKLLEELQQRENACNEDIAQLIGEVAALRELNAELRNAKEINGRSTTVCAETVTPEEQLQIASKDFRPENVTEKHHMDCSCGNELTRKFDYLRSEYQKLSQAHDGVLETLRKERKIVKAWKIYAVQQRREKKQRRKARESLQTPSSHDEAQSRCELGQQLGEETNRLCLLSSRDGEHLQIEQQDEEGGNELTGGLTEDSGFFQNSGQRKPSKAPRESSQSSRMVSPPESPRLLPQSSQTLEGEACRNDGARLPKDENENYSVRAEDGGLTVVSSKQSKRKRPSTSVKSLGSRPQDFIEIKREEDSDSSAFLENLLSPSTIESVDLDEVSMDVGTPRKRRALEQKMKESQSKLLRRRLRKAAKVGNSRRNGIPTTREDRGVAQISLDQDDHATADLMSLLEHESTFRPRLSAQTKRDPPRRKLSEDEWPHDYFVQSHTSQRQNLTHQTEKTSDHQATADRSYARSALTNDRPSLLSILQPRVNRTRHPPITLSSFETQPQSSKLIPATAHEASSMHRVDDFIVNPNVNQGFNYAFGETIRSKDQRRCLPGCNRPGCCGDKFRRLVEVGGLPQPKSALRWNSQDEDEEQRLLNEFVGQNNGSLSQLQGRAREELLMLAKAKHFADEFGKHRHNFQRAVTPPGFWRADMPTSQEIEDDRRRAGSEERRKLEHRSREAAKDGGRWILKGR